MKNACLEGRISEWPGRMDEGWMDDGGSQNTMDAVKSLFLSKPSNHSSNADYFIQAPSISATSTWTTAPAEPPQAPHLVKYVLKKIFQVRTITLPHLWPWRSHSNAIDNPAPRKISVLLHHFSTDKSTESTSLLIFSLTDPLIWSNSINPTVLICCLQQLYTLFHLFVPKLPWELSPYTLGSITVYHPI